MCAEEIRTSVAHTQCALATVDAMSVAIRCNGLTKSFGTTRAVDGLDLEVGFGEIHGFLGPNGSGKTVTMRILLGLLRADGGQVEVLGADPWRDAVALHRRMAYVPGDTNLWPNLTGGEIIDLLAGVRGGVNPHRRAELVDAFDLDLRKRARTYSKGNRQKVALVAALASDADLLILDEPTSGLDPLIEEVFAAEMRRARGEGRAVLLSSHELAEVEKLCDRVTIIHRGRTLDAGSLSELRHLTRTVVSAVTASEPAGLGTQHGVHEVETATVAEGWQVRAEVDAEGLDAALSILVAAGVRSLESHPPSLEELFLRRYREAEE